MINLQINILMNKAIQSFQDGDFDETQVILMQVLKSQSRNFEALHILGVVKGIKNQHQEALEYFKKALKIDSNNSFLHYNIAKAFSAIDENEKALKYHLNTTNLNPNHPEAWFNYGESLCSLNRFLESLYCYNKALALKPDFVEAWISHGVALAQLKSYEEALVSFDNALKINPQIAEAWSNRANTLLELKQYDLAIESYDNAISIIPNYADDWLNRGIALSQLKKYETALASLDKAISIKPNHSDAWYDRGNTLSELNQYEAALDSYNKAISINPGHFESWSNRGNLLTTICNFQLAEASYREAIRLNPYYFDAQSNLVLTLNYIESSNPHHICSISRLYGSKVSEKSVPKFTKWGASLDTQKLTIGLVSGDFSNHPVGFFIEGLIKNLDPEKYELHAFPTQSTTDDLTERIKPFFIKWTPIYGKSDINAATLIHQSGIQILIDLSGHTAHNRLPVFSYKPAPVQISWLGMPATTGLPEIDFVIGDNYALPIEYESQFNEKIWRLPDGYLCLTPPNTENYTQTLPALKNNFITFGSFNNLSKMNDVVIHTWARILKSIPYSKLFLKTKQLTDLTIRNQVLEKFAANGIEDDRLILMGNLKPHSNHLDEYKKVDIALDTFPYPGVTTSAEAIYMGVPVLSLKGNSFLSSTATSIAINAGLSDWVAFDIEDYVLKAVQFSSDLELLSKRRITLKASISNLPLFDVRRFANNFGDALLGIWNQCAKSSSIDL